MIDRINSFRIVRIVSEGERGALLHGVSEKSGERVAVRLIHAEVATEELERRCLRAVAVAQLLAHQEVVRLIEAGRLPDGSVYQIQEHLLGETLAGRLATRRRLPINELLRNGRQIASALSAAHARGIVHCALRPESVHLVPDPDAVGGERVKLNDWGLALVPAQGAQPAEVPPVALDLPTYLAPEQCRAGTPDNPGNAPRLDEAVGARVDVYALGVMLFQMASGHPPFGERSVSEIIAMHLTAPPPKLDPKQISMPRGLPTLVAAMLRKDAPARPTMREVEDRLGEFLAEQQLDPTLTPSTSGSIGELARALPGNNGTTQLRLPPVPDDSLLPGRWLLAVAFSLPVTIVIGLWWLFAPIYAGPSPSASLTASPAGQTSSPIEERVRPAKRKEAPAGITSPVARTSDSWRPHIPPLRDGAVALASQAYPVSYPPLRDGSLPQASLLSRLRYPPLRDGKAIAILQGKRRRR